MSTGLVLGAAVGGSFACGAVIGIAALRRVMQGDDNMGWCEIARGVADGVRSVCQRTADCFCRIFGTSQEPRPPVLEV